MATIALNNGLRVVTVAALTDEEVVRIVSGRMTVAWDDEIRESLHGALDDSRVWLDAYCAAHEAKHNEPLTIG